MKSSGKKLIFKVVDVNEPTKTYGELILDMSARNKGTWSFELSKDITLDSWKAFGLFSGQDTEESSYLEDLIIKRVPLRQRMGKDFTLDLEMLLEIIKKDGLRVASDSYQLVLA